MVKHRKAPKLLKGIYIAYLTIILLSFIYNYYILEKYGDVISKFPKYDILGKYKCAIPLRGCEEQVLSGWSIVRVAIYAMVGVLIPHAHVNIGTLSGIIELLILSKKRPVKFPLNIALSMTGYSIGSAMCNGRCLK